MINKEIQIRLLENVMKVAARAYWLQAEDEPCPEMTHDCNSCPHHEVCKAEFEFNRLITAEKNTGKM